MRKPGILITGAGGEIGHGLIEHFSSRDNFNIIAVDLRPLAPELDQKVCTSVVGDITDKDMLDRLVSEYEIHEIYHLAALLSTRAEYTPTRAHHVNVDGTLNLLELANEQAQWHSKPVKFLFPSSIAAYGLPSRQVKNQQPPLRERDFNEPTTMYGCNKLYCEHLGRYFTKHFRQLASEAQESGVDFRALRFPGLISAVSIPSGGTSDYAPEMIHAAAKNEPYACFVDENATIPFMTMHDGIKALVQLAACPAEKLSQRVYNVTSFSLKAVEIRDRVLATFPKAKISFEPDRARATIVDSWPAEVDDSPARKDWNWRPDHAVDVAFEDYLFPRIQQFYRDQK